jgi:type IV secretory pathway TraG/TraD family ATPase VirD4
MQADENEPMVVYDHKNDYQQFFDKIDREYIRLSSSGSTHTWNIFEEIEDKNDAREIARSVFADVEDASGSSGAYFGPAARQVFTIVLRHLKQRAEGTGDTPTNASLVAFFMKHNATEAYDILSDVDGFSGIASHLNPESDDQQGGVWSNLQLAMEDYFTGDFERGFGNEADDEDESKDEAESKDQNAEETVPDAEKQQDEGEDAEDGDQYADGFSIREYMENPNGKALVLDRPAREGGTTAPVFRLLIDLAAREALVDDGSGAYLVLDEIAKVPAINRLDELVNVGAGLNTQVFVTLQSVAQLRASYGEEGASAILSGFLTTALLRCDDPKSVEFVQSKLGKEKDEYTAHVEKAQLPRNQQKTIYRESKPEHEHVFSEAEINSWNPGEGVLVRPQSWAFGRVKLYDD